MISDVQPFVLSDTFPVCDLLARMSLGGRHLLDLNVFIFCEVFLFERHELMTNIYYRK